VRACVGLGTHTRVLYYVLARWDLEAGAIIPFFRLVLMGWFVLVVAVAEERSRAR
jgi:hypothetical protein